MNNSRRGHSHRATWEEKNDTFSRSQDHWLKPFRQEQALMSNYQRMLDHRLSKPKEIQKGVKRNEMSARHRVFKNSTAID